MIPLRYHRLAPLLLALAVLFSALGLPAAAASACEHAAAAQHPAVESASAPAPARMPCGEAGEKPCCCPVEGRRAAAPAPPERAGVRGPDCGCALTIPDGAPPAVVKAVRSVTSAEAAALPEAPFEIALPVARPWVFAAPAAGPPGGPERSSAPSRAPPACL